MVPEDNVVGAVNLVVIANDGAVLGVNNGAVAGYFAKTGVKDGVGRFNSECLVFSTDNTGQ